VTFLPGNAAGHWVSEAKNDDRLCAPVVVMGADGTKRLPLIQDMKWHRRFEAVGDGTPRMGVALTPRVADQRRHRSRHGVER
jgi:hypothetical protein